MTIQQLQQGIQLNKQIQQTKQRLQDIKDYFQNHTTLTMVVAGVEVEIPKATVLAKMQARIQELQDQLTALQTQFNNL